VGAGGVGTVHGFAGLRSVHDILTPSCRPRAMRSPGGYGRPQGAISAGSCTGYFPSRFLTPWYFSGGFPVVSCRCQHVRCCCAQTILLDFINI
jgi:hypothetical protein